MFSYSFILYFTYYFCLQILRALSAPRNGVRGPKPQINGPVMYVFLFFFNNSNALTSFSSFKGQNDLMERERLGRHRRRRRAAINTHRHQNQNKRLETLRLEPHVSFFLFLLLLFISLIIMIYRKCAPPLLPKCTKKQRKSPRTMAPSLSSSHQHTPASRREGNIVLVERPPPHTPSLSPRPGELLGRNTSSSFFSLSFLSFTNYFSCSST
jgi:hypothetical protein